VHEATDSPSCSEARGAVDKRVRSQQTAGGPTDSGTPAPVTGASPVPVALPAKDGVRRFAGRRQVLTVIIGMSAYLTVREVALLARCEHKSVRRAISTGALAAFRPANNAAQTTGLDDKRASR